MPLRASPRGRSPLFAERLFTPLPERYDKLAEVLSFGQNGRWRREMVSRLVEDDPQLVLDVATGPAGVARAIVRRSSARVTGIDLTGPMLVAAARSIRREGLEERVVLVRGSAERLPFPDATFDALSFTYLLRYVADPAAVIGELARVVKPGGVIASLEFHVPQEKVWWASWWCYTRVVLPLAGAALGGRPWYDVGRFLGPSISRHYAAYPLDWTEEAWRAVGIGDVSHRVMSLGGGVVMWGRRRHG